MQSRFGIVIAIVIATGAFSLFSAHQSAATAKSAAIDRTTRAIVAEDSTPNWHEMTKGQRKDFMKKVIKPAMEKEFQAFDPVRFKKFNCATCHGDGAKDESFTMPNPKLFKLPNTSEGFQQLMVKDSAFLSFMGKVVKPKMAAMLGLPEFNMTTKKGFGCMECHTN